LVWFAAVVRGKSIKALRALVTRVEKELEDAS